MTHDTEHSEQPTAATADFDRQLRRAAGREHVTTRSNAAGKEGTMDDHIRRAAGRTTKEQTDA